MSFRIPETAAASVPTPPADTAEIFFDSATNPGVLKIKKDDATVVTIEATAGADADAIHDNVAGEIALITEKVAPVAGDWLLAEDSEAGNAKKRVQIGNLPTGASALADLTDVTLSAPATGSVLVKSAGDWIDGTVDLADSDAVSGELGTSNIADGAVTYAKIQNTANASRLIGRGSAAGAGDVEEITIGTGLTLTGTDLTASAAAPALDDLTDVTLTAPATGSVLVKSAGDWVDGQVDLADADAVTGVLAKANMAATTVHTDQANTYSTGAQDFTSATSLTVPVSAGAAPTASGQIAYDSTANQLEYGDNGTNRVVVNTDETQSVSGKSLASCTVESTCTIEARDELITIRGTVDPTKVATFDSSAITTLTERLYTFPDASGTLALTSNKLSAFAATSSLELKGVISDETGSGALVFADSPTLVTPALGTPASGVLINCTGIPLTVNGSAASDADFDDATPAAPNGATNVAWQKDSSTPNNLSANISWGKVMEGIRRKPFFFADYLVAGSTGPINSIWSGGAVSGTIAGGTGTANHPGVVRMTSAAGANTGYSYYAGTGALILIGGGENFECIFNVQTLTNTQITIGFMDRNDATEATDGIYILIPSTGALVGKTSTNSVRSTTGTSFTVSTSTWYRAKIVVNADATQVDYYVYTDDGTQQWTNSLTTNIPTAAGRETSHGVVALSQSSVAIMDLDWTALWWDARALTR